jgi:hypothetical protein
VLAQSLGTGVFGIQNIRIASGQKHVYCAPLEGGAKRVRFEISKQCLGANFEMKVIPETVFYSNGTTPMPVTTTTRSVTYGSLSHPPGFVPPGTFLVEVTGLPVGTNCSGNQSLYHVIWSFS